MGASTSGAFDVIGAYVALPFGGFIRSAFRILLMMALLSTFAAASVVDALGPVMPKSVTVATLSRAEVAEDIARVLSYTDFNCAFFNATTRVDDFSNIFFARRCNFHVSRQAVSVSGVGCSGDGDH